MNDDTGYICQGRIKGEPRLGVEKIYFTDSVFLFENWYMGKRKVKPVVLPFL